jgi:hypothetical protein
VTTAVAASAGAAPGWVVVVVTGVVTGLSVRLVVTLAGA